MKVQELIEALQNLNPESEVLIDDARGEAYMVASVLPLEETASRNYAEDYAKYYISWYQAEEGEPSPSIISFYC